MFNKISDSLFQGDAVGAILAGINKQIDVVVYLGQELPKELSYCSTCPVVHIPLVDGKNDSLSIHLVVLNISYLELDDRVMIVCRQGLSRSVALLAAYQSVYVNDECKDYPTILKEVREKLGQTNEVMPHPDLLTSVRLAVAEYWENK